MVLEVEQSTDKVVTLIRPGIEFALKFDNYQLDGFPLYENRPIPLVMTKNMKQVDYFLEDVYIKKLKPDIVCNPGEDMEPLSDCLDSCYIEKTIANQICRPYWSQRLYSNNITTGQRCTIEDLKRINDKDGLALNWCWHQCRSKLPCTSYQFIHRWHVHEEGVTSDIFIPSLGNRTKIIITIPFLRTKVFEGLLLITPAGLVGAIGGNLGLILGFSLTGLLNSMLDSLTNLAINGVDFKKKMASYLPWK